MAGGKYSAKCNAIRTTASPNNKQERERERKLLDSRSSIVIDIVAYVCVRERDERVQSNTFTSENNLVNYLTDIKENTVWKFQRISKHFTSFDLFTTNL